MHYLQHEIQENTQQNILFVFPYPRSTQASKAIYNELNYQISHATLSESNGRRLLVTRYFIAETEGKRLFFFGRALSVDYNSQQLSLILTNYSEKSHVQ